MEFNYEELVVLNKIISNALLNGEIEFNDVTKSIHAKVADEICKIMQEQSEGGE